MYSSSTGLVSTLSLVNIAICRHSSDISSELVVAFRAAVTFLTNGVFGWYISVPVVELGTGDSYLNDYGTVITWVVNGEVMTMCNNTTTHFRYLSPPAAACAEYKLGD